MEVSLDWLYENVWKGAVGLVVLAYRAHQKQIAELKDEIKDIKERELARAERRVTDRRVIETPGREPERRQRDRRTNIVTELLG